jgi:hypothetical protein
LRRRDDRGSTHLKASKLFMSSEWKWRKRTERGGELQDDRSLNLVTDVTKAARDGGLSP